MEPSVKVEFESFGENEHSPSPPKTASSSDRKYKGKSLVWEHVKVYQDGQKALCNYCSSDFTIKGGTSAVLRHLKVVHPEQIDSDAFAATTRLRRMKNDATLLCGADGGMDSFIKMALGSKNSGKENWAGLGDDQDASMDDTLAMGGPNETILSNVEDLQRLLGLCSGGRVDDHDAGVSPPVSPENSVSEASLNRNELNSVEKHVGDASRKRNADDATGVCAKTLRLNAHIRSSSLSEGSASAADNSKDEDVEMCELKKKALLATIMREDAMKKYYQVKAKFYEQQLLQMTRAND